ncbi:EamA family transporter [Pseudonocardia aurantiaca]|uniref:EamA family transporter n=1 Tax=Pseudonocardia aurantiaca TaxID=75290 RepID=A0ABW4FT18_9PSEU
MPTLRTTPVSGVSFLIVAGVLWGTGGLLGSLFGAAAGLSPLAVATYRLGVGGLLIVGYLLVNGSVLPRGGAAWRRIAATGLLAALFQVSYFTAVSLTSVSLATLVTIGSSPVLVLLVRRRHAGRRQLGAVAPALLGLALLVGLPADGPAAPGAGALLAGSAFALLAAAGFSVMTLLAARPVPGLDAATTTGLGFTIGGAVLLPVAAATAGVGFAVDARSIALLVALALVPTAVAYTCYFRGLRSASAGVGVLMALLEPLTAAVLAALLLGERLGVAGVAGGLLLGVALVPAARSA